MSDTPRTDRDTHRYGDASVEWLGDWVPACACRIIERELNAANAKIKRLEEAGDALSETQTYDLIQNINWRRAKEFKP